MQTYYPNPRRIAQTTAEDFKQPACEWCERPISDDRCRRKQARFCSTSCNRKAHYKYKRTTKQKYTSRIPPQFSAEPWKGKT